MNAFDSMHTHDVFTLPIPENILCEPLRTFANLCGASALLTNTFDGEEELYIFSYRAEHAAFEHVVVGEV